MFYNSKFSLCNDTMKFHSQELSSFLIKRNQGMPSHSHWHIIYHPVHACAESHEVSQNMFSQIKYSPLSDIKLFLHIDQLIYKTTPSTGSFSFLFLSHMQVRIVAPSFKEQRMVSLPISRNKCFNNAFTFFL